LLHRGATAQALTRSGREVGPAMLLDRSDHAQSRRLPESRNGNERTLET